MSEEERVEGRFLTQHTDFCNDVYYVQAGPVSGAFSRTTAGSRWPLGWNILGDDTVGGVWPLSSFLPLGFRRWAFCQRLDNGENPR